ncbi:hypothetical protein GTA08_BOTSDO10307 [Botryosphaeria dothidea]|uniref:Uncharacterized protein n=1 Tax=Botryosphaeria dothidea TaxID=55169 RepID=A0A8H4IKF2_9PEZI|nr:hypothetical protein GTA08_BOTSDO10307 [Botryosphaeria dothidea]
MSSSTESSKKWASPRWEVAVARTGRVHQATDAVGSVSRAPGRPIHSLTTTIAPRLTLAMKPHCRADSTDPPPTPRTAVAVAARPGLPPSTARSARHSACLIGFKLEETDRSACKIQNETRLLVSLRPASIRNTSTSICAIVSDPPAALATPGKRSNWPNSPAMAPSRADPPACRDLLLSSIHISAPNATCRLSLISPS